MHIDTYRTVAFGDSDGIVIYKKTRLLDFITELLNPILIPK